MIKRKQVEQSKPNHNLIVKIENYSYQEMTNPVWERIHNSASELKKTMLLNFFSCLYNTFNKQDLEKKYVRVIQTYS